MLRNLAGRFRQKRLDAGAVQISLPEINLWIDESGEINLNRLNRESPGRMLVSELMILANGLMARFLAQKGLPAVFRAQPEPREQLFRGEEGSLFQNFMQRKHLARFVLGARPERHSGLGLEAYVTATSPIRKYFDLVTQRQIRAALGLETPYSAEEIAAIIQATEMPMANVGRVQQRRHRYWLLKHLESRTGTREEAIVLGRWRRATHVLLPAFMLECELQGTGAAEIKAEEMVQVTVQHVDARREMLTVFMA
jgi:exoribonuclease-2